MGRRGAWGFLGEEIMGGEVEGPLRAVVVVGAGALVGVSEAEGGG